MRDRSYNHYGAISIKEIVAGGYPDEACRLALVSGSEVSSVLSKAERDFLSGKKKVSKNYERKLRYSIRRRLQRY
ncbi:hypothetical protein [Candidatus Pyrohabitans sp.]